MVGSLRAAVAPGVGESDTDVEDAVPLEGEKVRQFRSAAARCNYLSQDRPDAMLAVKDVCREMAKPTSGSWKRLQRSGK